MPLISIILPCRNEEAALPDCLKKIQSVIKKNNLDAEIIVSDSSTDNSPRIARQHEVRLVKHNKEGYGIAYLEGFKAAKGKYIFMADADGTYDFNEIPHFIQHLNQGYDMVIGNRFAGKIEKDAMPWHHKHIGNPMLSSMLRVFFGEGVRDAHSGMRAIRKDALEKLKLKTTGMEFASEMVVKALKQKLKIKEVPINYIKRKGSSKLRSFADGWRHMRFMLLYSPLFLFLLPGLFIFLLGLSSLLWIYFGSASIFGVKLYYHPMFLSSLLTIIGYQLVFFALFAKTYAVTHLGEDSITIRKLNTYITIEKASILGLIIGCLGAIIYLTIFFGWLKSGFGNLDAIKNSIIALTFVVLGAQTVFSSFMLSILGIKER